MASRGYEITKRAFDVVAAGVGLVVLSPVIGATALAVKKNLGSPVLFCQERPGKDGKIFTLYKFRTMKDVDEVKGLVTNEQRITKFGRALRSTSLDELPSLVNVLIGDMSLVGPRPLLVGYLEQYTPEQARRHEVRPGVTGLAQVNGRNTIGWDEKFRFDVEYVDRRSLLMDAQIVARTVANVLRRHGVESEGHVVGAPFVASPEQVS